MLHPSTMYHFTARVLYPQAPFNDRRLAWRLWNSLKRCFPDALAATLMPNHLHLNTERADAARSLNLILGHLGKPLVWEKIETPAPIPDRKHLLRTFRYIALNPCRDHLVSDPLEWPWSTYRDVLGAVSPAWTPRARVLSKLRWRGSLSGLHRYVSADPATRLTGTPMPRPHRCRGVPSHPLADIASAALAATASKDSSSLKTAGSSARHLFTALAREDGWKITSQLAFVIEASPRTVRRLAQNCPAPLLKAGRLCLGDPRLRKFHIATDDRKADKFS